jgi:uncharacterized protein YbjT (DUF2867 family)
MSFVIAITGAAGKTGRAIVRALAARGAEVRAVVHREERIGMMTGLGASDVAVGDLTDRPSLRAAFDGVSTVYHICPNMRPDEVEIGERVIEACKRAGVERLVYHSVLHPQIEAMPHHWNKLRVEERLIESGLSFSILQPAAYMQNLKEQRRSVVEQGLLEVPYAESTRVAMVDLNDVAEAAARVLTENGHEGAIYELCGPEVMDQAEVAGVLCKALGRLVQVAVLDRRAWKVRAAKTGLSDYAIGTLLAMFRHYEQHGFWGSSRVLEALLGRPPRTLEQVACRWHDGSK